MMYYKSLIFVLLLVGYLYSQRPGDERRLNDNQVHPGFTVENIRPADWTFPIGAMDFLSDGRLVVATWEDPYRVVIYDTKLIGSSPKTSRHVVFATGLREVLGVKVVNDSIYILQKEELTLLLDHDNDGKADEYRAIAYDWTKSINEKEYAQGLVYDGQYFYGAFGGSTINGGTNVDPSPAGRQNGILRIHKDGTVEPFSGGMRVPGGMGYGYGEIWVTENQGGYRVSNPLINIREGRHYGRLVNPPTLFQTDSYQQRPSTYSPFAVRLPQTELANSLGTPLVIQSGLYKGHMMVTEVSSTNKGINRVFLEIIKGEYQGAAFRFTQGFEDEGVYDIVLGPDGAWYAGGNGSNGSGWHRDDTHIGLDRMKPSGNLAFEMFAVRNLSSNQFEIEFTKPIANSFGNDVSNLLEMRKWWYDISWAYGGSKQDNTVLNIGSAVVSQDRKKVLVSVNGLQEGWDHYFHWQNDALESQDSDKLWVTEAWYTLNNFGPGEDAVPVEKKVYRNTESFFEVIRMGSDLVVDVNLKNTRPYLIKVMDLKGRLLNSIQTYGDGKVNIMTDELQGGVLVIQLIQSNKLQTKLIY